MILPDQPGCYLFKDSRDRIIYVGKALSLKKRVASYFSGKQKDPKTLALVSQIHDTNFIVTDNEVEALVLENNLIKKHQPKYNILLKDSKRYAYIQLTDEKYPRLLLARQRSDKGQYFGPFVSAQERNYVMETVSKAMKLRTCRKLPKKACLRYHMGLCTAPCISAVSDKEYDSQVTEAKTVLRGKTEELAKRLNERMKKASKAKEFEQALELREKISALSYLKERQNMERVKRYDEDIINYVVKDSQVYLSVFNIHKGTLINKREFEFPESEGFLDEFIRRFYDENEMPKEVILPSELEAATIAFLRKKRNTRFIVPIKGEKKQLLELVKRNIEISNFADEEKLSALKEALRLNETPRIIECFDISHLQGTAMVASMVQFRNGQPDKSNYRRFKIRTVEHIDDFASIKEVVGRRYRRLLEEKAELPNLIVIDGGKGQLSSAIEALNVLGLKLPIISIAKREEEIYVPGLPGPLPMDKRAKHLIMNIRDESHRFAIKYNRLLRSKEIR